VERRKVVHYGRSHHGWVWSVGIRSERTLRRSKGVPEIDIEKKMNMFVTGVLERNEVGATDGYTIYDRWLTLRLSNGIALRIFDDELISSDLEVGQTYDMILIIAVPRTIHYLPSPPPNTDLEAIEHEVVESRATPGTFLERTYVVRGTVLDPSWQAPQLEYRCMVPDFYDYEAVLVQTAIGRILLSRTSIEDNMEGLTEQVTLGGYLEWERSRLDLMAVL
jgi:hypothetical protein